MVSRGPGNRRSQFNGVDHIITGATLGSIATDAGSSSTDFITNDTTLVFSGSYTATGTTGQPDQLGVWIDGAFVGAGTLNTTNHTWTYDDTTITLSSGSHTIEFSHGNGNEIKSSTNKFVGSSSVTIDTTAPTAAVAISAIFNDTGSSSTDFITNDTTLTVTGTNGTLGSGESVPVSNDVCDGLKWQVTGRGD